MSHDGLVWLYCEVFIVCLVAATIADAYVNPLPTQPDRDAWYGLLALLVFSFTVGGGVGVIWEAHQPPPREQCVVKGGQWVHISGHAGDVCLEPR